MPSSIWAYKTQPQIMQFVQKVNYFRVSQKHTNDDDSINKNNADKCHIIYDTNTDMETWLQGFYFGMV